MLLLALIACAGCASTVPPKDGPDAGVGGEGEDARCVTADVDQQIRCFVARQASPPLEVPSSLARWQADADALRARIVDDIYEAGVPESWRSHNVAVNWGDVIYEDDDLTQRPFLYEALPSLWLPGLAYLPKHGPTPRPLIIEYTGHSNAGRANGDQQKRALEHARRGAIALNIEFAAYGASATPLNRHRSLGAFDIVGVNAAAPFYLAARRVVDLALALDVTDFNVDPTRIGVTGISGGGWQSVVVGALDTRVSAIHPVAGFSSLQTRAFIDADVGDFEQQPANFGTVTDYTHLVALLAGRPTLLTFNSADACCFAAETAVPPLLAAVEPVFGLYGTGVDVTIASGGEHSYDAEVRLMDYEFFERAFGLTPRTERAEPDPARLPLSALPVTFPAGQTTFNGLALAIGATRVVPPLPTTATSVRVFQDVGRTELRTTLALPQSPAAVSVDNDAVHVVVDGFVFDAARRAGTGGTVIVLGDKGAAIDVVNASEPRNVVAFDPLLVGTRAGRIVFQQSMRLAAAGQPLLGRSVRELLAIVAAVADDGPVEIRARGQRTAHVALAAAALDERIAVVVVTDAVPTLLTVVEKNLSLDKAPELFVFDGLRRADTRLLAALIAPRSLTFVAPTKRHLRELGELRALFTTLGGTPPL